MAYSMCWAGLPDVSHSWVMAFSIFLHPRAEQAEPCCGLLSLLHSPKAWSSREWLWIHCCNRRAFSTVVGSQLHPDLAFFIHADRRDLDTGRS